MIIVVKQNTNNSNSIVIMIKKIVNVIMNILIKILTKLVIKAVLNNKLQKQSHKTVIQIIVLQVWRQYQVREKKPS